MKYFDSHAHYYDERFSEELDVGVDSFIDTLLSDKVSYIVNIGASPETSRLVVAQAKKHENMYICDGFVLRMFNNFLFYVCLMIVFFVEVSNFVRLCQFRHSNQ